MNRANLTTAILVLLLWSCTNKPQKKGTKSKDFIAAGIYYNDGKWDSAFRLYSSYVTNADDTLHKAQAYRYMSQILWPTGDLYFAEENLAAALQTLDTLNQKHWAEIGYVYNNMGNIKLDLNYYDSAIYDFTKAIFFLKDDDYMLDAMNGKAISLQNLKRYDEAIAIYDSIFILNPTNQALMARIIDNRAMTKWLRDPTYPALNEFWKALKIRFDSRYMQGLNANYAHLSDYYANTKPDSALWYANKMYETAKGNNSPPNILLAMDKLINLAPLAEQKEYWYKLYKSLNDSLQRSRDTSRFRFATIRYDVQKRVADNRELKDQNRKQRLTMYALITGALLTIAGIWLAYRKRRKRIKQESETAIRNAKLKTSKKVHDVVANGLYVIMNELEHNTTIEKEPLINRIEGLYEKSRNISYEDFPSDADIDYNTQVHKLLSAFSTEKTKVIVVGNQPAFWNQLSVFQKQELHLALNEIMINMKKHSVAKSISIVFKPGKNEALIIYKDDGIGFASDQKFGNGLNNTVSRINSLNGELIFGKSEKGGLSITISIPL